VVPRHARFELVQNLATGNPKSNFDRIASLYDEFGLKKHPSGTERRCVVAVNLAVRLIVDQNANGRSAMLACILRGALAHDFLVVDDLAA
jgi:hypothetical protein